VVLSLSLSLRLNLSDLKQLNPHIDRGQRVLTLPKWAMHMYMKLLLEPLLLLQAMLQPLSKLNPLAFHLEAP
jgi:hypothetical protein